MADLVALLVDALPDIDAADETLISSTVARALRFAPCISATDFPANSVQAVFGVLKDVVLRRYDRLKSKVAAGTVTSKQMGERQLTVDARSVPDVLFQPTEIAELQAMCADFTGAVPSGMPVGSFPEARPWPC